VIDWGTPVNCLELWYHMYGVDIGPLTVFVAHADNETIDK
jgi:hypothetical protein